MQCWKQRYTKREAQQTLNYLRSGKVRRNKKDLHESLKMYLCPNGHDHYHLTHSPW